MAEFKVEEIKARLEKLEKVKAHLKEQFIGIDNIIDTFINSVKVWYVLPDVQTRPLIVNLWGMTGVGKTDMVRKFVRFIEFNNNFIEIQMDSKEGTSKVQDFLEGILDDENTPAVLLLDEMQRFRSIDEDGKELTSTKFQDVWMLLSDGKFQSASKNRAELIEFLLLDLYWKERRNDDDDDEEVTPSNKNTTSAKSEKKKKEKKTLKYHTHYWDAARLKRLLKLPEDIKEIMKWSEDKKITLIQKRLKEDSTFEGSSYSKMLIIISGNIDEAYRMADSVTDADMDADIYHEFSKKINFISIKSALQRRFKPEQIARFGNIHLIYPSLSKDSYEK